MAPLQCRLGAPTRYLMAPGCRKTIAREASRLKGAKRWLIVTDPGLADLPWVEEMKASLAEAGLEAELFRGVRGNPREEQVLAGLEAARGFEAEGIIAVGGGSPLDAGKAIAFLDRHPGRLRDYVLGGPEKPRRVDPSLMRPLIALPTTAGSGAELSTGIVITDAEAGAKLTLLHRAFLPVSILADPELTIGLPAHLTAATGMDALTHCLEAFCVPSFQPVADGTALEGLRLIKASLARAVQTPGDIEARSLMLTAAGMGALAFQKGLGLVHAMAHPLGALLDIHHGLANAVLLPYVLLFNKPAIAERLAVPSRLLELDGEPFEAMLDWILELRSVCGIPASFSEVKGIEGYDPAALAAKAMDEVIYLGGNPRKAEEADIRGLFEAAHEGRLDRA